MKCLEDVLIRTDDDMSCQRGVFHVPLPKKGPVLVTPNSVQQRVCWCVLKGLLIT